MYKNLLAIIIMAFGATTASYIIITGIIDALLAEQQNRQTEAVVQYQTAHKGKIHDAVFGEISAKEFEEITKQRLEPIGE